MRRLRGMIRAVTVVAAVLVVGTGCDGAVKVETGPDAETSTSPEFVKKATEFGGWVLPPNGKVLLARREVIRQTEYRLAVEMPPADLVWMLDRSGFTTDFRKLYELGLVTTIAGPELGSSPNVQRAQDTFTSPTGKSIFRRVAVDERSADTRIVHLEFQGI